MKFGIRKLESWDYQTVKKSFRFDTIPARDGRTDGQLTRCCRKDPRYSIASRGLKRTIAYLLSTQQRKLMTTDV